MSTLVTYLQCVSILLLCKQNISQINEKQVLIKLSNKIFLYLSSSLPDQNGHHHHHHHHLHIIINTTTMIIIIFMKP